MKKQNVAKGAGGPSQLQEERVTGGDSRSFVSGSRKEPPHVRLNRQMLVLAHCMLDLCRLQKQEGWVDILADEFSPPEAADSPHEEGR